MVRLLVRAWRAYRRGRRAIRVVAVAFLTGAAGLVLRRLRNRPKEAELAYSPPPTPTVPPGPPPLDAGPKLASEADPA